MLKARGARELQTMLKETDAPGLRFLEKRGWKQVWRRHEFRVDTTHFEMAAPMPDLGGLRLESLEALASDPQRDERLHELDWTLFQDVPMDQNFTKRPLEAWVKQELQDPTMRLDLSFALLDDTQQDPLHGPYVGYTTLMQNPSGFYIIGMTGVKREYRGRGLAKVLKLASMRALKQQGGGEIRTFNDPPNVAMIGMNRALGFVQGPDHLRLELQLEPETA
ncbi:GNAT family N-acetyltransferase [Deinococcus sp. KNUC1210]|uniref:GNAT family N-acetyltransferase n=1 Tax=Deinococcus sp. KNUC1210 TaxID=2917691 RepID=UPI001EF028A3|nr:GNAT family N-acetyltransferase [Deinococcus sp. KNUC1210]ULH14904.1 GNAT family N-acetyltransferase [Deinococcus sp. KNUC1210]